MIKTLFSSRYDTAISVSGQDPAAWELAEAIVHLLTQRGVKTFYYRDPEEAEVLLGANLKEGLAAVYSEKAKTVILIAGPNYGREGYTQLEWNWIRERRWKYPEEQFLIPIVTEEEGILPELKGYGYQVDVRAEGVAAQVEKRLGKWSKAKKWLYPVVLGLLLGPLAYRMTTITFIETAAIALFWLTVALSLCWLGIFWLAPRIRPDILFRPSKELSGLHRSLYVGRLWEKLSFAFILALGVVTHLALPFRQAQIGRHASNWLEGVERAAALHFFSTRASESELLDTWIPILVDPDQEPASRGRALDMLYQCLKKKPGIGNEEEPVPVSPKLYEYVRANVMNADTHNIHELMIDVDVSQARTLDYADLSSLSFIGPDYPLKDTPIKQANLSGSYFYNYDATNADLRWNDCSNADFPGLQGTRADFSGSGMEETSFFLCQLDSANFERANLTGATFVNCQLRNARFTNAALTGVTFKDCDLTGAVFVNPGVRWEARWGVLAGVSFIRCRLDSIDFQEAEFSAATLLVLKRQGWNLGRNRVDVYSFLPEAPQQEAALVPAPAAKMIGCSFTGASLAGVHTDGLVLDSGSFAGLSLVQKAQVVGGGFQRGEVLSSAEEVRKMEEEGWEWWEEGRVDSVFHADRRD